MELNRLLNVLSLFILINVIIGVHSEYLKYYIQQYCDEPTDYSILLHNDGPYSSLVLMANHGPTKSNAICRVKIIRDPTSEGIILTPQKVSLSSTNCENYIQLGDTGKSCDNSQVKDFIVTDNELLIEFGTGINSTSEFEFVITSYSGTWVGYCPNPNHIRCHGRKQECIYKGLECDGFRNCPSGSDEEGCPVIIIPTRKPTTTTRRPTTTTRKPTTTTRKPTTTTKRPTTTTKRPTIPTTTTRKPTTTSTTRRPTITTQRSTKTQATTPKTTLTTASQKSTTPLTQKPTTASLKPNTTTHSTTKSPQSTTKNPSPYPTTKSSKTSTLHPSSKPSPPSHNGGKIAGIIIGVLAVVFLVSGGTYYWYKKRHGPNGPNYRAL